LAIKRTSLEAQASNIMQDLALRFFDNRCFVTHEKFKKRGFVIHHLKYIENDVRRSNYPNGENGRLQYLKDLVPMVEHMPFRFMLLKNGVHTRLDHPRNGLSRMKKENQMRLFMAAMMTIKEPRKTNKKRHYHRH
jgi:hypothetical protein